MVVAAMASSSHEEGMQFIVELRRRGLKVSVDRSLEQQGGVVLVTVPERELSMAFAHRERCTAVTSGPN